jgi:(R,R)-butanediol dehydrogenase/meso-butanediol dehydrogenase/diacetyl reductase
MKAAVFKALRQPLVVETTADPTPGPGDVVIRVGRCGICGSDLHMTEDPVFGVAAGTVLGHEYAGEVVEIGPGVERLVKGDRVTVMPIRACGHCASCLAGQPAWCPNMRLEGGGYAQYSLASERQCLRLPRTLSLEDGALVEPLSIGLHGVVLANLPPGARVLVIGAGPIGLAVAYWARRLGASRIVVSSLPPLPETLALQMGANACVGAAEGAGDEVVRLLGGAPDVVFECVGRPGMIAECVRQVRPRGTIVVLGLCTVPDTFVPFAAVSKEVRIQTSAFYDQRDFEMAIDALDAGAVAPHAMITDTVSLDDMPRAFEGLRHRTTQCKTLVKAWAD